VRRLALPDLAILTITIAVLCSIVVVPIAASEVTDRVETGSEREKLPLATIHHTPFNARIRVVLESDVNSDTSRDGDCVTAHSTEAYSDGYIEIPVGTQLTGKIFFPVEIQSKYDKKVVLLFQSIETNRGRIPIKVRFGVECVKHHGARYGETHGMTYVRRGDRLVPVPAKVVSHPIPITGTAIGCEPFKKKRTVKPIRLTKYRKVEDAVFSRFPNRTLVLLAEGKQKVDLRAGDQMRIELVDQANSN
jgi:hypothetical protein